MDSTDGKHDKLNCLPQNNMYPRAESSPKLSTNLITLITCSTYRVWQLIIPSCPSWSLWINLLYGVFRSLRPICTLYCCYSRRRTDQRICTGSTRRRQLAARHRQDRITKRRHRYVAVIHFLYKRSTARTHRRQEKLDLARTRNQIQIAIDGRDPRGQIRTCCTAASRTP